MHKGFLKRLIVRLFIISIAIGLYSCESTKEISYFQDISDTTKLSAIKLVNFKPPLIHIDEVLSVNIYTIDLNATLSVNVVNAAVAPTQGAVTGADESGYLVDRGGNIEMAELGKIKVEGLTVEQAQQVIKERAVKYFNDPIVIVKDKNVKITFIGEFEKTGTYIMPSEKFTILDALGFAGGLTDFGKRDDILLLRQNDSTNTLSTIRINLKSSNILKSPYYYLQNNDVLLANPTRSKAIASDQVFTHTLGIVSLVASLLTTLIVLIKR